MKRWHMTVVVIMIAMVASTALVTAEFYNRAPDVLPWLKPEMMTKENWISRMPNPDAVILSLEQIQAKNADFQSRMASPERFAGADPARVPAQADLNRWPGRFIVMPDLGSMQRTEVPAVVREEIGKDVQFIRGQYMGEVLGREDVGEAQSFGNLLGIEYADWEIAEVEAEMALDIVPDNIRLASGMTVRDTQLRLAPTIKPERVGLDDAGVARWDVWSIGVVPICTPVSVLHSSRSGMYVFVLSPDGYGWLPSEDVAFASQAEIDQFTATAMFVVCTGDRVPFYSDATCQYASGSMRMGDRLPMIEGLTGRKLRVPTRLSNGQLAVDLAWITEDADVSEGYLPYTRRNVIELAWKFMGNPYDWSGGFMGRNHETWIRDVFSCFGFELPYHAELFTFYANNNPQVVMPDAGMEAQKSAISANDPGITIQTCGGGHSELYIGTVDGEPYVLDTSGYNYVDEDGTQWEVRRMTVCDMSIPAYFLRTPFSFASLK